MRRILMSFVVATGVSIIAFGVFLWVLPGRTVSISAHALSESIELVLAALPMVPSEKLNGEEFGRINILLVGRAGTGWIAGDLTDSIIVASVAANRDAIFISIPRDLFIEAPGTHTAMRINTLGPLGDQEAKRAGKENDVWARTELLRKKAEEITGLTLPYTAIVDVGAVEKTITALDGVQVLVPQNIHDPAFPTPGGGIETFIVDAGWRVLDGRTAGKYVRTRHDSQGDFGRMRRQQQVIEAALSKARGLKLLFDFKKILELVAITQEYVAHNLSARELKRFWELTHDLEPDDLHFIALDRTDANLLQGKTVVLSGIAAPVLVPKAGMFEYSEIRNHISQILKEK